MRITKKSSSNLPTKLLNSIPTYKEKKTKKKTQNFDLY